MPGRDQLLLLEFEFDDEFELELLLEFEDELLLELDDEFEDELLFEFDDEFELELLFEFDDEFDDELLFEFELELLLELLFELDEEFELELLFEFEFPRPPRSPRPARSPRSAPRRLSSWPKWRVSKRTGAVSACVNMVPSTASSPSALAGAVCASEAAAATINEVIRVFIGHLHVRVTSLHNAP